MTFWIIVGAVVVAILALCWWADRRRGGRRRAISGPHNDPGVGEGKVEVYRRGIQDLGPGSGR